MHDNLSAPFLAVGWHTQTTVHFVLSVRIKKKNKSSELTMIDVNRFQCLDANTSRTDPRARQTSSNFDSLLE